MPYTSRAEGHGGAGPPSYEPWPGGPAFTLGEWRVIIAASEIECGERRQRLERKAVEVLVYLAQRPGEVVGREELLGAVWPGVVVGDDTLTQAVIKLRKALGDDARQPRYIETIAKRGYRLIAHVGRPEGTPPGAVAKGEMVPLGLSSGAPDPSAGLRRRRRAGWVGLVLVALAAAVALLRSGLPTGPGFAPRAGSVAPVIAVLPLGNLSADPQRDYFTDGVTEDIIDALGRFSELRVIARNSVEQFKKRPPGGREVLKQLGARYLVQGSLRESAGQWRVTVDLSDAESGLLLWSGQFETRDIIEIEQRVVDTIVGILAVRVNKLELARTRARPPETLEAYDLVLRARALNAASTRAANREARALLGRALEIAPSYAGTYFVLAQAEFRRAMYGWVEDADEAFSRGESFAREALRLDDPGTNARAHAQLGKIYAVRGRYDEALAEVDLAITLNPSDSLAIEARAESLLWLGRIDDAIAAYDATMRLDPAGASSGTGFGQALALYTGARYREALAIADATLLRYPGTPFVVALRAAVLAELDDTEAAHRAADELRRLDPYFRAQEFGDRFARPEHRAHLQQGLRKAGL